MSKRAFIIIFIIANLFFIFFQIYKNSHIIQLSFTKQRYEKEKQELIAQKNMLRQQLCALQNKATIKERATIELAMEKITLQQIKTVPHEKTV